MSRIDLDLLLGDWMRTVAAAGHHKQRDCMFGILADGADEPEWIDAYEPAQIRAIPAGPHRVVHHGYLFDDASAESDPGQPDLADTLRRCIVEALENSEEWAHGVLECPDPEEWDDEQRAHARAIVDMLRRWREGVR